MIDRQGVVYFVAISKHIKIGFSANLAGRLKAFQTSALEVELLLAVPGDRDLEVRLHKLLSDLRIAREMFHRDWRIFSFIDRVERAGLEQGLQYLEETTPQRLKEAKTEARRARDQAARFSKAEKDAHFASLVADRKQRLGW